LLTNCDRGTGSEPLPVQAACGGDAPFKGRWAVPHWGMCVLRAHRNHSVDGFQQWEEDGGGGQVADNLYTCRTHPRQVGCCVLLEATDA
jgi:hypothetical protein